jgi:hypothetical protein
MPHGFEHRTAGFMRIGKTDELTPAQLARQHAQKLRERDAAAVQAEKERLLERAASGVALRERGVTKASPDEVRTPSRHAPRC